MIESSVMQKIRQLLKGRPLTNLPKVLNRLKYYGIGRKVTRSIWMRYDEPSYWTVTRVRFKHDMYHARAWGILTFRGKTEDRVRKIRSFRKKQWILLDTDEKIKNPFVGKRPEPKESTPDN